MGNRDKNRQFGNVCKELGIVNDSQIRRFHEYINTILYEDISDYFSYKKLLEVAKEFLEYDGSIREKVKKK